ncbi:MAG: hypothetical protein ACUZ77_07820 [Candidatus Brocadiales bacterium]
MAIALQDLRTDIRAQHIVTFGTEVNRRTSLQAITNEYHVILRTSPYYIRLEEVPDSGYGVTITGYTASNSMPVISTEFYVDYSIGYVYFYSSEAGKQVSVNYFGKGSAVDAEDINAHTSAIQNAQIIIERLRPYAQETPDQSIGIKSGVYFIGKTWKNYTGNTAIRMGTGGEYQVSAMSANYYNKVLFTLDSAGLLRKYEGAPAANPKNLIPPPIPAGELPVCIVTVHDDGTGSAGTIDNITDSDILDIRATVISPSPEAENMVFGEDLSAQCDGTQTVFTVTNAYAAGTLNVYLNGVRQRKGAGNQYTETTSTTFTMSVAPLAGDTLLVDYVKF